MEIILGTIAIQHNDSEPYPYIYDDNIYEFDINGRCELIVITPPPNGNRVSEVTYWGWPASSFAIDINVASNNPIESVSNATHVSGDTYRITIQPGTSFFLPPYQYIPYTIDVVVRTVDGTEKTLRVTCVDSIASYFQMGGLWLYFANTAYSFEVID